MLQIKFTNIPKSVSLKRVKVHAHLFRILYLFIYLFIYLFVCLFFCLFISDHTHNTHSCKQKHYMQVVKLQLSSDCNHLFIKTGADLLTKRIPALYIAVWTWEYFFIVSTCDFYSFFTLSLSFDKRDANWFGCCCCHWPTGSECLSEYTISNRIHFVICKLLTVIAAWMDHTNNAVENAGRLLCEPRRDGILFQVALIVLRDRQSLTSNYFMHRARPSLYLSLHHRRLEDSQYSNCIHMKIHKF